GWRIAASAGSRRSSRPWLWPLHSQLLGELIACKRVPNASPPQQHESHGNSPAGGDAPEQNPATGRREMVSVLAETPLPRTPGLLRLAGVRHGRRAREVEKSDWSEGQWSPAQARSGALSPPLRRIATDADPHQTGALNPDGRTGGASRRAPVPLETCHQ